MKAAGCAVAKKLGFKTELAKPQEPRWRKRIKDRINSMKRDLSALTLRVNKLMDFILNKPRVSWEIDIR